MVQSPSNGMWARTFSYPPIPEPLPVTLNPQRVAYFYEPDVGNYVYYLGHPMKPHRIRMAHNLIVNYGLCDEIDESAADPAGEGSRRLNGELAGGSTEEQEDLSLTGARGKAMQVFRPKRASGLDMTRFHTDEYIELLEKVTPDNQRELTGDGQRCLTGDDCPGFEGVFEFCSISAGGSLGAAEKLNSGAADIAINWAGGLHHAKKTEASGFCYINDIVLGILELLRIHPRVLYIDIDVHHGDGVEEAFYTTDRVMTASFHRFGEFFPGTGDVRDVGMKRGKGYAVNVPLRDGITDDSFHSLFKPVVQHIIEFYRPGAIVLQMGADSLAGDKLGGFNMTLNGHAECARFVKTFNIPLMVLGGGGYTIKNVARAWANETAVLCERQLSEDLPYNQYMEYFGPRYKLEVLATNAEDHNSPEYLEMIKRNVFENLRHLIHAPSAQMQEVPGKRMSKLMGMKDGELSDPEDEHETKIRRYLRRRNLNAGYSSESEQSEDDVAETSHTRYRRQGGTRRLPVRMLPKRPARDDTSMGSSEMDSQEGMRRKRTFFRSAARPIIGMDAGGSGMLGLANGLNGIKKTSVNGFAVRGVSTGMGLLGSTEGWQEGVSRAGSPVSVA